MKTDSWCPNCAQMVAPKRKAPEIAWILGALAIIAPVMLLDWHWLLAGVTGTVITVVITLIETRSICPICKTDIVKAQPPAIPVE